jgi:hypothetical protein
MSCFMVIQWTLDFNMLIKQVQQPDIKQAQENKINMMYRKQWKCGNAAELWMYNYLNIL